jgi:multidrug resistance efflux pump
MNNFTAYERVYGNGKRPSMKAATYILITLLLVALFVPWTQNIRARGNVTGLKQEQRTQEINTIISGRIEKWHVKEGDFVKKGDTLIQLSEIKTEYLDPKLIQRTAEQIRAKQSSVGYYKDKISATESQIDAISSALRAKISQLENKYRQAEVKLESDSMDMLAATNDWRIASLQFNRQKSLFDSGLVSLTQLEQRNQAFQSAVAKKTSSENRFLASKQELNIIRIEFAATQQEYAEKISKAETDRFGSLSSVATTEAEVAKLRNEYASYVVRNSMYYVIAPQDGQVVNARKSGIGEIIKEGEPLVRIVPADMEYAVELYVRPVDLPLLSPGQKVRFLFDGFPAIVFSGWPNASYGTYQGIVSAVEGNVSENGKFKVLVKEDPSYRKWPTELRIGTGANGIALLKNVPVWYELWRNINSFPPDFYRPGENKEGKK